ncbi:MBL fold metallo-hydrolase [Mycobacteroides sp. LB1]|uniref:MBL fold metallo-hydrolase n=1 Tax=Mycobacteroides sp. LB1 TaxID=2750814 RepID=UPI0015DDE49F|nr:MBL fold metallo-hydrolase [Mycobacteroides sp. LB1]
MRIHHLNCGTMAPLGKRLIEGKGAPWQRGRLVCHCLLIDTGKRLVLVDTGFGLRDIADPVGRIGRPLQLLLNPEFAESETAVRQVHALGYDPEDVTDVVLTHHDHDHVGGVDDFPNARLHVHAIEAESIRSLLTLHDRVRYTGQLDLMSRKRGQDRWVEYSIGGDWWFGFEAVRQLSGLPEEIAIIPLAGHSRGHVGVVIDTGGIDRPRWLVHAGDAFMHPDEMRPDPRCPMVFRVFQNIVQADATSRLYNAQRLRELAARDDVQIINAHHPYYLDRAVVAGEPTRVPAR